MKNRKILRLFTLILLFILFISKLNFEVKNNDFFNDIIVFISIVTGFNITALSIIATSPFSKSLYQLESKYDNSKTLLHVLVEKFKFSTLIYLMTVGVCLFYILIKDYTAWSNHSLICTNDIFTYPDIPKALTVSLAIFSFVLFFDTVIKFADFVTQSAKANKENENQP